MPRRSRKVLLERYAKAEEQVGTLISMQPVFDFSEEDVRLIDEEAQKFDSMTDAELEDYFTNDPEGRSEAASLRKEADEIEVAVAKVEARERTPIEKRPNPLGRKLIRSNVLKLYQQIHVRVVKGMPRKAIATELRITEHRLKMALRTLRRLTGRDYKSHFKNHVHQGDEYKRCPQCRGYVNQDVTSEYDSNPRRRQKKKEIPVSRINLPGEHDEKLDWLDKQNRQRGSRRKYKPPSE